MEKSDEKAKKLDSNKARDDEAENARLAKKAMK